MKTQLFELKPAENSDANLATTVINPEIGTITIKQGHNIIKFDFAQFAQLITASENISK